MTKKCFISFIVLFILCILINPILNASAMATGINDADKSINESIEKFVDKHSLTTAGMAVSIYSKECIIRH